MARAQKHTSVYRIEYHPVTPPQPSSEALALQRAYEELQCYTLADRECESEHPAMVARRTRCTSTI